MKITLIAVFKQFFPFLRTIFLKRLTVFIVEGILPFANMYYELNIYVKLLLRCEYNVEHLFDSNKDHLDA